MKTLISHTNPRALLTLVTTRAVLALAALLAVALLCGIPLVTKAQISLAPSSNSQVASSPVQLAASSPTSAFSHSQSRVMQAFGKLPLYFEGNRGQTDPRVKFLSRGAGQTFFFTPNEVVLALTTPAKKSEPRPSGSGPSDPGIESPLAYARGSEFVHKSIVPRRSELQEHANSISLRMTFVGANRQPSLVGEEELTGKVNYFIGNDPKQWRTNIPTYSKVRYRIVYPGIDVVYHGNQRQLEYDFVVAPGADPRLIQLNFQGADKLEIDSRGDLVVQVAGSEVHQRKPVIYQEAEGVKQAVTGGYVLLGERQAGFQIPQYDRSRPLVIDPVLAYSTYLGGSDGDRGFGIAVDSLGNAYVTGFTLSTNFPTANPFQASNTGNDYDAFVAKLNAAGSALVYSTYLGGSGGDRGFGIAVDSLGNAYVTGGTRSSNFPTANPFQATNRGFSDAFVTKLNAAGSVLVYSTYLGGSGEDEGIGIAVDSLGNAYVTGGTGSTNFPTANPFQATNGSFSNAFVTKLNAAGSALVYSTYLGGNNQDGGFGIAVDSSGSAYVVGRTFSTNFPTANPFQASNAGIGDAFVTKLNAAGSALVYSTYLGGSGFDQGVGIAADSLGNAYVTGATSSTNFPTANPFQASNAGGFDAFVTKLNAAGSVLVYSTYLGGSLLDQGLGIAVDSLGNAYVTGETGSTNFPTANPFQASNAGIGDAFVTKLNAAGSALVYSTYMGGNGFEEGLGIAADSLGNAYVTGWTFSTNFPTANPFQASNGGDADAFVAKITASPGESITDLTNTINSFNLEPGTANSLEAKLNAAQASLAAGNTTAACNQINAFINEVQAHTGPNKKLTSAQADQLIAAASQLKAMLGCT